MRSGAITAQMHDAGQDCSRTLVFAHLSSAGSTPLERIPGGCAVWLFAGWGQSVKEWSAQDQVGCNGRTLNQHEAKGILVGVLAVHCGYSR